MYAKQETHYVKNVQLIKFVYTKTNMNKKILGIGNAIVDVLTKVDDDFLKKNNLIKGSMKLIDKLGDMPIVITLHDQRLLTGGCHYTTTCQGFMSDCSNCPKVSPLGKKIVKHTKVSMNNSITIPVKQQIPKKQ